MRLYFNILFSFLYEPFSLKCTEHVAASKLYKNELAILNAVSFYVSMSPIVPSNTFKRKLGPQVNISGKRKHMKEVLFFKIKMSPILI